MGLWTVCLEGEVLYMQSRAVPFGIALPDAWPGRAIQAALLSLAMLGYSWLHPPTSEKAVLAAACSEAVCLAGKHLLPLVSFPLGILSAFL